MPQVSIEDLCNWSTTKKVETRNGPRNLRTAYPSQSFWSAWKASKDTLRLAGVSVGKDRSGEWEACWWLPLGQEEQKKQEEAQAASRAMAQRGRGLGEIRKRNPEVFRVQEQRARIPRSFVIAQKGQGVIMPRPNKAWERKSGKQAQPKRTLLRESDSVFSATTKLSLGMAEAQNILLMAIRKLSPGQQVIRLLDADDMELHGNRIIKAYHEWAGNDYEKLVAGLENRDAGLVAFIKKTPA